MFHTKKKISGLIDKTLNPYKATRKGFPVFSPHFFFIVGVTFQLTENILKKRYKWKIEVEFPGMLEIVFIEADNFLSFVLFTLNSLSITNQPIVTTTEYRFLQQLKDKNKVKNFEKQKLIFQAIRQAAEKYNQIHINECEERRKGNILTHLCRASTTSTHYQSQFLVMCFSFLHDACTVPNLNNSNVGHRKIINSQGKARNCRPS